MTTHTMTPGELADHAFRALLERDRASVIETTLAGILPGCSPASLTQWLARALTPGHGTTEFTLAVVGFSRRETEMALDSIEAAAMLSTIGAGISTELAASNDASEDSTITARHGPAVARLYLRSLALAPGLEAHEAGPFASSAVVFWGVPLRCLSLDSTARAMVSRCAGDVFAVADSILGPVLHG